MKKLLVFILIITVLIGGVLGYALLNANKLIAKLKPQLEETISGIVGAQIQLDNIAVSVLPQTALKVSGLHIKDSQEPGPAFDEFALQLNLKALLGGKLNITKISLLRPQLTLIKDSSGMRLKGLPFGRAKSTSLAGSEQQKKESGSAAEIDKQPATPSLPLEVNLEGFQITHGSITFEDQLASKNYTVSDIEVSTALDIVGEIINTKGLSFTANALGKFPVSFSSPLIVLNKKNLSIESFKAALASAAINGSAAVSLDTLNGKASITSDGIDIAALTSLASDFVPALSQFGLGGKIIPNIQLALQGPAAFSAEGAIGLSEITATQGIFKVSELSGDLKINASGPTNAKVSTENLKLKLNQQEIAVTLLGQLADNKASLENFALKLLGGSVTGNVNLNLDESKAFSAQINGGGISIEQALAIINAQAANISGVVESLASNVTGNLGPNLMQSLGGTSTVRVINGELKGFNLAGLVLKAVNNLPFLTGALYSSVPESERGSLDSSNTAFRSLDASIALQGSRIRANSVKLLAPIFSLEADGTIGFDKSLDLSASILFNQAFSKTLVGAVTQLKNILDSQGQLVIPLKIQGTPPLVLVYPNVQKLVEVAGKKILAEKATEAVKGLLEKKGVRGLDIFLGF